MPLCWKCQKDEWKKQKLENARVLAREQAVNSGETMAIIKIGVLYNVVPATQTTGQVLEYISKHE